MLDSSTDGHVHTALCRHAVGEMEQYVQAALDRGLRRIFFLEHFEAGIINDYQCWLGPDDFAYYRREGERLRRRYAGKIEIGLGVEVGYNPREVAATKEFLATHRWDRVGLSCHFLAIGSRHYNLLSSDPRTLAVFSEYGVARALGEYFALLAEAVTQLPGTQLCHLDAALRHHPEVATPLEELSAGSICEQIFQAMAARGMALEINTSGYSHRRRLAYPAPDLLDRAARFQLPLTAGSDAHRPEEVGRFFDRLP
ncbi:MAG TPA: histidinol-phosphatase HisJ family protein [Desulfurivibrio alkaliphilus]|uniref:Histidinol-phosphatase n=1 Tax=Desulfurivibrio alkaliphilus TaxID=427923 RepID=A0A7C2THL1_9BACT|nr:histidinol-phosphatase HisJ family protein [Desulfurivibrio alkaliphilus]